MNSHTEPQYINRMKKAMIDAAVNNKELALKIGVNPSTITRYLKGMRIAEKNKRLLADALGVSTEWLFLGIEKTADTKAEYAQVCFSGDEVELIKECITLAQQTYTKAEDLVAGKARVAIKEESTALKQLLTKVNSLMAHNQIVSQVV